MGAGPSIARSLGKRALHLALTLVGKAKTHGETMLGVDTRTAKIVWAVFLVAFLLFFPIPSGRP
jgi:hypothetical protein